MMSIIWFRTERLPPSLLPRRQGLVEIYADDNICPHFPHDVYRNVPDNPAVDQKPAVQLHRGECSGHGHTGPCSISKPPAFDHHHLAGLEVRGNSPVGDRQLVEIIYVRRMEHEHLKKHIDLLVLDQALGQ